MLALSPQEVREFLPGSLYLELRTLGDAFGEFDPTAATAAEFAERFHAENPEVLVTGWRTPALPAVLPPRLRYVCHLTGTVRPLLTHRHLEDGLLVTNWGGSIALVVAEGAVTERHLRLLRPGAVFVNTGRGRVVDEAGLVKVAREGKVLFGLDVFAVEPLAKDHPLRGLRNVNLTPHLSGPTTDRRRDAGAHALRNLRAYVAGQPLDAVVTSDLYLASS